MSAVGTGAVILVKPNTPVNLAVVGSSDTQITINWEAGASDSPILDYNIKIDDQVKT